MVSLWRRRCSRTYYTNGKQVYQNSDRKLKPSHFSHLNSKGPHRSRTTIYKNPLRLLGRLVRQGKTKFLVQTKPNCGNRDSQSCAFLKSKRTRELDGNIALD